MNVSKQCLHISAAFDTVLTCEAAYPTRIGQHLTLSDTNPRFVRTQSLQA